MISRNRGALRGDLEWPAHLVTLFARIAVLGLKRNIVTRDMLLPFQGSLPGDLRSKGHRNEAEVPDFWEPRAQSIMGLDGGLEF